MPLSFKHPFLLLVLALLLGAGLTGCGGAESSGARAGGPGLRVLCSVFPVYEFTRNVAAGCAGTEVSLMLPPALGCPHDYLLTPQDMEKIAGAGVLVINGLGLEEFLGEPLKRANPRLKIIDASAGAAVLKSGEHGANPHLFASPRAAAVMARAIGEGLAQADPAQAAAYRANAAACAEKLDGLADEFAAAVKGFPARRIVTAHEVFDYLARDCGLEIVAVIEETPGQAPSAARMLELVGRIKSSGAAAVFTEPQYPAAVGQALAREAGVPVADLDPVASGPDNAPPDYYEKTMRKNLETLKKILGKK